jgi:hypothetical protein
MEEMSFFNVLANAVGLFILFSEIMLITHYRNQFNDMKPMSAKLKPVVVLLIVNTVILAAGMYLNYISTAIVGAVTISSFLMGRTIALWERRARSGSFN